MPALVIACGNRLRCDDGVGARTVELMGAVPNVETRIVQQLTPELADDAANTSLVCFVDADVTASTVEIARLTEATPVETAALTHFVSPAVIVALARELHGWTGDAYRCSLPVDSIAFGDGLSERAEHSARIGARALRRMLQSRATDD